MVNSVKCFGLVNEGHDNSMRISFIKVCMYEMEKSDKIMKFKKTRTEQLSKSSSTRLNLYFQIERDQKKTTSQLEGKKLESASRLGMGLGGLR